LPPDLRPIRYRYKLRRKKTEKKRFYFSSFWEEARRRQEAPPCRLWAFFAPQEGGDSGVTITTHRDEFSLTQISSLWEPEHLGEVYDYGARTDSRRSNRFTAPERSRT